MRYRFPIIALPVLAAGILLSVFAAEAHQRVYADAYGNLIVINPSGYKQIIVGKGHLADEVRAEIGEPEIIYHGDRYGGHRYYQRSADRGSDHMHRADGATCIHNGVVFKGRALMYGLNPGEAANISKYCR